MHVRELLSILRASHNELTALAGRLRPADLSRPSYAREWTVAQVYSHLGSGAEIGLVAVRAALGGGVAPPDPESIWARWNAKSPEAMANDYIDVDDGYLATVEALDDTTCARLRVPFQLNALDLATCLTFRLTEHTLHNWDIRVNFDAEARLAASAVPPLVEVLLTGAAEVYDDRTARYWPPPNSSLPPSSRTAGTCSRSTRACRFDYWTTSRQQRSDPVPDDWSCRPRRSCGWSPAAWILFTRPPEP